MLAVLASRRADGVLLGDAEGSYELATKPPN